MRPDNVMEKVQNKIKPCVHPGNLEALNREMEHWTPRQIMLWVIDMFESDNCALGTGFGPSGIVLTHLASTLPIPPRFFYLDTDVLFQETYALKLQLEKALGIPFERVATPVSLEEQHKNAAVPLWYANPNRCCFLRKVVPLRNYLSDKHVWITGLRKDQSFNRQHTPIISWDSANKVLKISPLATWSEKEVWHHIMDFELPYNALHDAGYPSIGCEPCTQPALQEADPRSGRWAGSSKTECGIHYPLNVIEAT